MFTFFFRYFESNPSFVQPTVSPFFNIPQMIPIYQIRIQDKGSFFLSSRASQNGSGEDN
jgi:hypothetical protein